MIRIESRDDIELWWVYWILEVYKDTQEWCVPNAVIFAVFQ